MDRYRGRMWIGMERESERRESFFDPLQRISIIKGIAIAPYRLSILTIASNRIAISITFENIKISFDFFFFRSCCISCLFGKWKERYVCYVLFFYGSYHSKKMENFFRFDYDKIIEARLLRDNRTSDEILIDRSFDFLRFHRVIFFSPLKIWKLEF